MGVDRQLLEKYHSGLCTAEERRLVEAWLDDDALDSDLPMPESQKMQAQQAIWNAIASDIDHAVPIQTRRRRPVMYRLVAYAAGIAASIALVWWIWPFSVAPHEAVYDNSTGAIPHWFKQSSYDMLLGEASKATIDIQAGKLIVEGNLLFKPKRDIHIQNESGSRLLRRGETYFILEGEQVGNRFIFSKSELTFLPPAVQRKLKQQLNIS